MTGESQPALESRQSYLESISLHLEALLNSHQGYCPHIPEYGQPDLVDLYRKLPMAAQAIGDSICLAIQAFEPRLAVLELSIEPFDPQTFFLQMNLACQLVVDSSPARFSIRLSSQGRIAVKPLEGNRNG